MYHDFGIDLVKQTDTQRWYRGHRPAGVDYAGQGQNKSLGAFEVESYEEFDKYVDFVSFFSSKTTEGLGTRFRELGLTSPPRVIKLVEAERVSNRVEQMSDAPGGGYIATIRDPEGFLASFKNGRIACGSRNVPEILIVNNESVKPRIFEPEPAAVHKVCLNNLIDTSYLLP